MSKVGGMATDRISGLPDSVLFDILAFVPTKYVMRTSILSKKWKRIWASVPNLDFVFEEMSSTWKHEYLLHHDRFLEFVRRVFLFRNSLKIHKLRLHCYCRVEDVPSIADWIRIATRDNVVELDLHVKALYTDNRNFPNLELPQHVFTSKTLVVLKVKSNCISYAPPTSGCFPNLKELDVKVEYPRGDSMEKLFSCCPVLEDLSIDGIVSDAVSGDMGLNFRIAAPELKKLRMNFICDDDSVGDGPNYSISINAPKLENIDIKHDFLPNYSFENVKSLAKGSVDICRHYGEDEDYVFKRAPALLEPFSNVKHLSISVHSLQEGCLPAFDKLSELKLVLRDCYYWDLLTALLKKSPNLESLFIEHEQDQECVDIHETPESYLGDVLYSEERWSTPDAVPICLTSHLETITFRGFEGYPHEKKVAVYLSKNGKALKKMTIQSEFYKEFKQKKGSRDCRVELI